MIGEAEKAAVAEVLESPMLVHGPRADRFEADFADYIGGGQAVSVANCTAALHLAYFQLGLGAGDEVIVPAQTHAATAHAVEITGARPVFVDAEPETGNIDIDLIEAAIGPATRALSVVHYLGMPVDMDRIMALAHDYDLFVVEDAALAIGSRLDGVHAGLLGDCGTFSFYPVKHMTTAEGGMFVSKYGPVAEKVRRQKAFGLDRTVAERTMPGIYDVTMLGFNYRMNEIQAAIGIEQLKRVDGFLEQRRTNFAALSAAVADIDDIRLLTSSHDRFESSHYCLAVVLTGALTGKRPEIVAQLKAAGVGSSVYYPGPVPALSYYRNKYGLDPEDFPVATTLSKQSIALPVGPHLEPDDMHIIAETLKKAIRNVR
jgi:dTDP-4-amino-4,6-dideoxygalactose transaminase